MTGTFAALGAMMALFSREKTGRGQVVDAAIYESVMAFMESVIPEYALAGHTRERTGAILPKVAPSSAYPCSDGMVIIGANQDTLFQRLAKMMDKDWGTDERFASHNARGDNQTELDEMISEWTSARSVKDVLSACNANAVPCGPVNTAKDMLEDAHIKARNAIVKVFAPLIGADVPMQAPVPKLSATPGRVNSAGPALGEHTDAILDVLGYSDADRERLRNDNVI